MKIAWLAPYLPHPANTGARIRTIQLAQGFSEGDALHLFCRRATDDLSYLEFADSDALPPFASIRSWPARHGAPRLSLPPPVVHSFPDALYRALQSEHRREAFDVLIAEHSFSAYRLPALEGCKVVLDEHNIESSYFSRAITAESARKAVSNLRHWLRWRHMERRAWQRADLVTTVTDRDATAIEAFSGRPTATMPNGIAFDRYRFIPPSQRQGQRVLFVGLMSYQPNIDAARLLAEKVMPLLWALVPDASLTIAGRDPTAEVRGLAGPRIEVTGTVDDITALFDDHAAYAMALEFGAGSSLKVLEPLSCGLPLVASSFSVRGFALAPEKHFLAADTPAEMAKRLAEAMGNRARFDDLAKAARQFASGYAWSDIAARFADRVRFELGMPAGRASTVPPGGT